ncbi:MAG: hypothetical protein HFF17_01100 [Oscillospiraceae bacterium]|nr:hypothetical protein [Oscillospiraceae bacterium]
MKKALPALFLFAAVVAVIAWDRRGGQTPPSWTPFSSYSQPQPVPPETQAEVLRALGLELTPEAEAAASAEYPYEPALMALGYGEYDWETDTWTPTSRQVFYMDGEVVTIEGMYDLLFQGLESISRDELTFTEVQADFSGADWKMDTGTVPVSFRVNEVEGRFEAVWMGDWIDFGVLDTVNSCLTGEKRFYFTYGGQGEIIFYCDAAWAKDFTAQTGLPLWDRQDAGMWLP